MNPFKNCLRQVHLDFHNSPYIGDLLVDFDAVSLARQYKEAEGIDIIEERMSFAGQVLHLPEAVSIVREYPCGRDLRRANADGWVLPADREGRLLLEAPGFFR